MRGGSDIEVKMFPDRLVISNPGGLFPGMTLSELRQTPHRSERRNPLIASTCFLMYLVERYGTGTTRIVSECMAAGLPEPEFIADAYNFQITFWKSPVPLTDRQRQAVAWVKEHSRITNAQYQKQFAVSRATATRELEELTQLKVLRKVGITGRGVYYVLDSVTA
jgi:ATP-dependent DNA helicase RecG